MSGHAKQTSSADQAPLLEVQSNNCNQTEAVVAIRLDAEEVEAVIAPRLSANHNESVLA